jgi:hypothetical protein
MLKPFTVNGSNSIYPFFSEDELKERTVQKLNMRILVFLTALLIKAQQEADILEVRT